MSSLNQIPPVQSNCVGYRKLLGRWKSHFALAIAISLTLCAASQSDAEQPPNILFIMSDDHGYQALSCYDDTLIQTPNLDRIAKEGMRFDRCFVTNSICGPCRAVVLTGKYSHVNGFARNGQVFNGSQMTLPKYLGAAGYSTAVIGKWHLGSDPTGFDYYHVLKGQGPYYNPDMLTSNGEVKHTGYTTDIITDLSLAWLKTERDPNKPFLLMCQHKAPHRNWMPSPKHLDLYEDRVFPEPESLFDDYSGRTSPASDQDMTIAKTMTASDLKLSEPKGLTAEQLAAWNAAYKPRNEAFKKLNLEGDDLVRWKFQRYMKDYLRCVTSVDENVGRVLDYLDESGLSKNTIVIYTSDQGWYLGEHGWFDKRWMYEESFRTPLMVRWPGVIQPGSTNDDLCMNLDFAETMLGAANVAIPADMQGLSLVPLLKGQTPEDWRKSVYYHYYEFPGAHSVAKHYGVRTDRYKLIHFYEVGTWELFDLEKDPREMRSVYDDPLYAEVLAEMEQELARLREHYQDDNTVVGVTSEKAKGKAKRKTK